MDKLFKLMISMFEFETCQISKKKVLRQCQIII